MNNVLDERFVPYARWTILRTIWVGGRLGATEKMVADVLHTDYLGVSIDFIRNQFDYLRKRGLAEVEESEIYAWRATLTRAGTDLVEYQIPCESGIIRPPKISADG